MTKLLISTAIAGLLALSIPALAQDNHRDRGNHDRGAQNAAPERPAPQEGRPQGDNNGRFGRGGNPGQTAQNAPGQDRERGRGSQNMPAQAAPVPPPQQQAAQAEQRNREDRRPSAGTQNAPAAQPATADAMRAQGPNTDTRGPSTDRRAYDNNRAGNNYRGNDRGGYRGQDNNVRRGPDTAMRAPDNAMRGGSMRGPDRNFRAFQRNFTAPHRFHAAGYRRPRGWYPHHWVFGEILPRLFWSEDYWLGDYMDFGLEPPPPGTVWVRDGYDALLIDRFTGEIIQVDYNVFY